MSGMVRELCAVYRRVPTTTSYAVRQLSTPVAVAALANEIIGDSAQERFLVLHLDIKNRLHSVATVGVGTVGSCPVTPSSVFQGALLANAASIILCHNHPSGDPTPSHDDDEITRRLVEAGRLVGIPVLDHVIIADGLCYSHAQAGRVG